MTTLVLETSTGRGGVALFENGELVFEEDFVADRSHSAHLFAVIERALGAHRTPGQIVVGLGPGSYAGVRISISAALGLAVATGAALLGLPSLCALAEGEYLALGDARRSSYYWARVCDGAAVEGPLLLERPALEALLVENKLPVLSGEALPFPGVTPAWPSAARLGRLALAGRGLCARDVPEPIYLREPHITTPKNAAR